MGYYCASTLSGFCESEQLLHLFNTVPFSINSGRVIVFPVYLKKWRKSFGLAKEIGSVVRKSKFSSFAQFNTIVNAHDFSLSPFHISFALCLAWADSVSWRSGIIFHLLACCWPLHVQLLSWNLILSGAERKYAFVFSAYTGPKLKSISFILILSSFKLTST